MNSSSETVMVPDKISALKEKILERHSTCYDKHFETKWIMRLLTQWWAHLSFDKHDPIARGEILDPQRVSHLYWTHQNEHLVPIKQSEINQGKLQIPSDLLAFLSSQWFLSLRGFILWECFNTFGDDAKI